MKNKYNPDMFVEGQWQAATWFFKGEKRLAYVKKGPFIVVDKDDSIRNGHYSSLRKAIEAGRKLKSASQFYVWSSVEEARRWMRTPDEIKKCPRREGTWTKLYQQTPEPKLPFVNYVDY